MIKKIAFSPLINSSLTIVFGMLYFQFCLDFNLKKQYYD